ncbi:hypothetical protein PDESU_01190 [Pontiella desulfatans]|uniref:YggT family protein n=1 Tax=Pontiella desulfatans TaxID=2750659 RepID=A0A6C2TYE6_PONDE|nr:hypothetical protein [Pontiella desulfatans]VGO12637.1 hypothetical protein PDESU_01190 [Pontiella desulfatans]
MNLIILVLDLYIAAHAIWWFLLETNRAERHSLTPILSRICEPYCRIFQGVELKIRGNNAAIAVPIITLVLARLVLSALH